MPGFGIVRFVMALVVLALLGGAGVMVFDAGVAQGVAQAGGAAAAGAPGVGGYYGYFGRPFGFLGILFPLFFFFVIFSVMKAAFWGHMWGGHHVTYAGRRGAVEEWHRQLHENLPPTEKEPADRA